MSMLAQLRKAFSCGASKKAVKEEKAKVESLLTPKTDKADEDHTSEPAEEDPLPSQKTAADTDSDENREEDQNEESPDSEPEGEKAEADEDKDKEEEAKEPGEDEPDSAEEKEESAAPVEDEPAPPQDDMENAKTEADNYEQSQKFEQSEPEPLIHAETMQTEPMRTEAIEEDESNQLQAGLTCCGISIS